MDDFHRHVRLPRELLALLAPVPEPEREAVRAAICEALSDAGIQVTGVRTDAIGRGPNYDEWAIPTGQLASLKEKIFDVITQYIAGELIVPGGWKLAVASVVSKAAWSVLATFRARTLLSHEQAELLRVLIKAPPGEGWNVDDLVSRLPGNAQLSASDV